MSVFTHLNVERLPDGWRPAFFGDLVAFRLGRTPPRNEKVYWDDPAHSWVSISDMSPYGTIVRTAELVSETAHRKIFRGQLVPAGHTLMSFKLTIGRVARLGIPAYHNEAIISFRPDHPDVDEAFLFYYLSQIEYAAYRDKAIKGDTLNKNKLKTLEIALPPLDEQRQIAAVLSAVQRAIDRQERLTALTAELKKALMQKLFTEGTHGELLKRTEIGLVPQSWTVDRLDQAGDVIYGIQAAVANNVKPVGTRILTNKNINLDGNIVVDKQSYFELRTERHRRTLLNKGDILFNWRSGSKEHVGKTAYFDLEGEWVHSSFILRIRPREGVNGRFLFHYLTWLRESKYFVKLHNYAVNAKFNKSAMNALPIVLPSPQEQEAIAAALDAVIKKFKVCLAQSAALNRLFRNFLYQLMTAQTRVNDLDLSALEEASQQAGAP